MQGFVSKSFLTADKEGDINNTTEVSLQFEGDEDADAAGKRKQGTFMGVYVPTCETMWCVR